MARRNSEQEGIDRSKVRVFYAEADGTTQSIQDLLRALASTMGRPGHVQVPPKLLQTTEAGPPSAATEPMTSTNDEEVEQASQDGDGQATTEDVSTASRRKRGEGINRDRNAGLTIVKSLNLQPEGKESLKAFVKAKKPQNQMEHIAVYTYYLKRTVEESKVGFSHLFTCFKEVGERRPGDLPQTCRNVASTKGWIDTADQEDLKITTRGENFVEHELPQEDQIAENGIK